MLSDLLITGKHSILVDWHTHRAEFEQQKKYFYGKHFKINDKYLLLAACSKKFQQLTDRGQYTYYHIVLEDDGIVYRHYGIWANGVLTESQHREGFLKQNYIQYQDDHA